MASYDLLLFMLKIETSTGETNSMPFLVLQRDHLRSTSGIICGSGLFAVQFADHFRPGDHLRLGIIGGAVQYYQFVPELRRCKHLCFFFFVPFFFFFTLFNELRKNVY